MADQTTPSPVPAVSLIDRLGLRPASGVGNAGWGHTALAFAVSFIYFFPVLWIILTAFKTYEDALAVPAKFFFTPTFDNFSQVFNRSYSAGAAVQDTGFTLYFFNSLFISGVSVLLALALGTLAAFGFSRYPLKGNDTYLFMILSTRMLPAIVVIIPIFIMFRVTGLAGSYAGIIALYTAFNLPFAIWMLKSFMDDLHRPIEEAARLDGSSELKILWRICLPQMRAGLAATAIIAFVFTWNDFLFSLLLTSVDTRTVPVAMTRVVGADVGVNWGVFAAIGTLYLAPVLLIAFFLQGQLMRGATFGTLPR